jgi:hypothetical protein
MKPFELTLLICAAASLAACGGGGGGEGSGTAPPQPQVLTGRLHAGTMQGVRYATATQAGSTDVSGTFRYLAGEPVSFSIGAIQLGTVTGSSEVSIFMLAGLAPPSTELALRRELTRMLTTNTLLSRAANMYWLLLSLDADGNPDNGLDVRNRDAALSQTHLDFDVPLRAFGPALAGLAPELNNNIPESQPVVRLFRSHGIRMSANALFRAYSVYESINAFQYREYHYDPAGELVSHAYYPGDSRDPFDFFHLVTDALGRETSQRQEIFSNGAVVYTATSTSDFDLRGNELERVRAPLGYPPQTPAVRSTSSFDSYGRVTSTDVEQTRFGAVIAQYTITYTRDPLGNPIETTFGGTDASWRRIVRTFDAAGHALTQIDETYGDSIGAVTQRLSSSSAHDASGRLLRHDLETDENGDGSVEMTEVETFTYDAAGRPDVYVNDTSYPSGAFFRLQISTVYEADGRVRETIAEYSDETGTLNLRDSSAYTYDSNGMLLEQRRLEERPPLNFRNLTLVRVTYNEEGARQTQLVGTDTNPEDGVLDYPSVYRYEYALYDDAVAQIVREYFPSSGS